MLAASALGAPQADPRTDPIPRLVVSGTAEVAAAPDRARVLLGATSQAPTAAAAQQQTSQIVQRAIGAIRELGIPDTAIRTVGLSLSPVYSTPNRRLGGDDQPQAPQIVGHRASDSVEVVIDDLELVGAVIDAGVAAEANELGGLSFELRDDTQQRAEALRAAVASARTKAEALAFAAGVRLGEVHLIQEGGAEPGPYPGPMFRTAAMESGTPVQAGQVTVRATVTMTWGISPAGITPGEGEQR